MNPPNTTTDARRALFAGLIDHAPTFPPAQLPLAEGLAEHQRVRDGDTGWIVNRFVCPASKLAELGDETLRLSVVLDEGRLPEADERIEAVEAAGIDPEVMIDAAPEVYCELPLRYDVSFRILQLGELGIRAKVRCGGATTPRVPDLAGFVSACRRLGVPFKATAGLHHPVRDRRRARLSQPARGGRLRRHEEEALAEEDESAFAVSADAFSWRERSVGAEQIAQVRQELFVGFGSCSAQEPIDGLETLGLLPG